MKSQRPSGTRTMRYIILVLLIQLVLGIYAGSAIAGVTLEGWSGTERTSNADLGTYEYVQYGRYPQSEITDVDELEMGVDYIEHETKNYLIEPIVWRVLSVDASDTERKGLLLSDQILDAMEFGTSGNYGESGVRDFLLNTAQGGFYSATYFSTAEQGAISPETFETTENPLFLLSVEQVQETTYGFLSDDDSDVNRAGKLTAYGKAKDPYWDDAWWTRSPNGTGGAWYVRAAGSLIYDGVLFLLGVRPAFSLNLESLIFKSASNVSNSAAAGGSISNPYVLYVATVDVPDASVDILVSENKLTISFDQPVAHAYTDTANAGALAAKFTVSDGQRQDVTVSGLEFKNGKLVLTLSETFTYGADTSKVTVAYKDYENTDTDGIGLLSSRAVLGKLNDGSSIGNVTNATPKPNERIDGSLVRSVSVANEIVTISWQEEDKENSTYSLNAHNVTITYSEDRFDLTPKDGGLTITAEGMLFPEGTSVILTAKDASGIDQVLTHLSDTSYELGDVEAGTEDDNSVFHVTADKMKTLPGGTYDLTFATAEGANPAFIGVFAVGYIHSASRPSGPVIALTAAETAAGGGVEVSALVTSGDLPQADVDVTFVLTGASTESESSTTGVDGNVAPFTLKSGLANGSYSVSAEAEGYATVMKSVTVSNGSDGAQPTGSSSNSNCNSGVGAAFFALAGLFLVGKKKR